MALKPHPDLPNIPLALNFAETKEQKDMMRAGFINTSAINRGYNFPPGTPKDRVEMLRQAFEKTIADPEFLKDADKSNLEITALNGKETQTVVEELFEINPEVIAKLKTIIK